MREELGIETTPTDFVFIHKFSPSKDLFYFRQFYLLLTDQEPVLSPEHTKAVWLPPEKLYEFVGHDVAAKRTLYEDIATLLCHLSK